MRGDVENMGRPEVASHGAVRSPAVIFDLDGTLVDSLDDLTVSLNLALGELGLGTHSRAAIAAMVGDGATILVARAVGRDDAELCQRVSVAFRRHYAEHCVDHTRLYPGMEGQLDLLVRADWPLAVLSNKPDAYTRICGVALLERWPFVAISGARDGVEKKPHPGAALALAARMERSPGEVFFVGDGVQDLATARAAGMVGVGVLWGYRSRAELAAAGPDLLVERPEDLVAALGAYAAIPR